MMKYSLYIAVLALLGEVSATELRQLQLISVKPSDEVCNGDANEDRELEDEDDPNDMIVDDNGFSHQWVQTKLESDHQRHLALAQKKVESKKHSHKKHKHMHHHKHHHKHHQMV